MVMSLRGGAGVWGARRGSIAYHVLSTLVDARPDAAAPAARRSVPDQTLEGGTATR